MAKVVKIPDEYFVGLDPENDEGDLWRGIKRWQAAKRVSNLETNLAFMGMQGGWTKHSEYHYSRHIGKHKLNYWPSRNKWQWGAAVFTGTFDNLVRFIKNRA